MLSIIILVSFNVRLTFLWFEANFYKHIKTTKKLVNLNLLPHRIPLFVLHHFWYQSFHSASFWYQSIRSASFLVSEPSLGFLICLLALIDLFLFCLLEVDSSGRPVLGTKRGASLLLPFHGVFLGRVGDPLGYNFVAGIINGEDNLVAARNFPVFWIISPCMKLLIAWFLLRWTKYNWTYFP